MGPGRKIVTILGMAVVGLVAVGGLISSFGPPASQTTAGENQTPQSSILQSPSQLPEVSPEEVSSPSPVQSLTPIKTSSPTPQPTVKSTATPKPSFKPTSTPRPTSIPTVSSTKTPVQSTTYGCNCSKTCTQISSCAEAQYLLKTCGCSARDADGDGIACDGAPLNCQK